MDSRRHLSVSASWVTARGRADPDWQFHTPVEKPPARTQTDVTPSAEIIQVNQLTSL